MEEKFAIFSDYDKNDCSLCLSHVGPNANMVTGIIAGTIAFDFERTQGIIRLANEGHNAIILNHTNEKTAIMIIRAIRILGGEALIMPNWEKHNTMNDRVSQITPKDYHVDLGSLDVESSSIEELEDNDKEMDTIDADNIDWATIHASHKNLIKVDDDEDDDFEDEDDDFENEEEEDEEEDFGNDDDDYENDNYSGCSHVKDRNLEMWEEILKCENDPDFFLKVCEFRQSQDGDTQLGRECYNKLRCYRISTNNQKRFQETVKTLLENYMMFGFTNISNKPYSRPSTQDPYWRVLKDTQDLVNMKPSLLDSETKQMLDNLLEKKEQSGLWYKIKKLFN